MKLELNVIRFNNEDVIATSGQVTYTISGLGDRDNTNFSFTSSDGVYNYTSANALKNSGDAILDKEFYYVGTQAALSVLIFPHANSENLSMPSLDTASSKANGTYIFDGTKYVKQ